MLYCRVNPGLVKHSLESSQLLSTTVACKRLTGCGPQRKLCNQLEDSTVLGQHSTLGLGFRVSTVTSCIYSRLLKTFRINWFMVWSLKSSTRFNVKILNFQELAKEQALLSQCNYNTGLHVERL